ncbi:hypothetical protein C8N37_105196 [Sphingobacterium faecium]|nr:hypothetical protein C8N37_105196 [Sphingobacterium faecium]
MKEDEHRIVYLRANVIFGHLNKTPIRFFDLNCTVNKILTPRNSSIQVQLMT